MELMELLCSRERKGRPLCLSALAIDLCDIAGGSLLIAGFLEKLGSLDRNTIPLDFLGLVLERSDPTVISLLNTKPSEFVPLDRIDTRSVYNWSPAMDAKSELELTSCLMLRRKLL
jgi:hypothetical protein